MLRRLAIGIGLVMTAGTVVPAARAESAQVPGACVAGSGTIYWSSGLLTDVPGCEGEVPLRASALEQGLHESKVALLKLQRSIEAEDADQVQRTLVRADERVSRLGLLTVITTERDAAEALSCHRSALVKLRARTLLLSHLDELRSCHAQGLVLLRKELEPEDKTATMPDMRAVTALVSRADACVGLARRVMGIRAGAGAPPLSVDLSPGVSRTAAVLVQDFEAAQRVALARKALAEQERDVVRGRWLRVLFGDRLRVFNQHPDELPEYDGKARGPLPASVVPRWHYHDRDGKIETYLFRRNKLVSKLTEDSLRS